jgi:glycosyltransferase involved in cell wall biosynthesis
MPGMKILHIVPSLYPSSLQRDLFLLHAAQDARMGVCTLGDDGAALQPQGVRVKTLAWNSLLDPRPLWRLARWVREWQPSTVHVWGLPALRAFRLALGKWRGQVVGNRLVSSTSQWNIVDRWLLRGVDRILVRGPAEAARCRHAGVQAERLRLVPPGMTPQPRAESVSSTIVCAGALQPNQGFWDAIWALDILRFVAEDIELVIAGEGPERARLQRFADNAGLTQRVRLVGEAVDRSAILRSAAVVWVPSRADTGARVVLEAMAAGRPVIASRWPGLAELVVDDKTGWLVDPGNKMELAQKTRRLLEDPLLRSSMGEAARRRVADHFGTAQFVSAWWRAWADLQPRAA